jgi:hypothetical protein
MKSDMKRKTMLPFLLFGFVHLILPALLFPQSNHIIDQLLQEEKATYGKAAYLVFTAAGTLREEESEEEAMKELEKAGLKPGDAGPEDPISLGRYSYLIMRAFSMGGGLFYSLFPSPRYASRELGFKGYIREDSGAYRTLTGREAIAILGRVLRDRGGER